MELELPFPRSEEEKQRIISKVEDVFVKRSEAKRIMRDVLLNVTPVHDFDDENNFMTLI